jgi:hypothetical protein
MYSGPTLDVFDQTSPMFGSMFAQSRGRIARSAHLLLANALRLANVHNSQSIVVAETDSDFNVAWARIRSRI